MRTQAARPLRALGALLAVYAGGRIAVGARYPTFSVIGLQLPGEIAVTREEPRSIAARPQLAAVGAGSGVAPTEALPATIFLTPLPVRMALLHDGPRAGTRTAVVPRATVEPVTSEHVAVVDARPAVGAMLAPPTPGYVQAEATPTLPVGAARGRTLSGSAWLLLRDGSRGASLAPGGTLGGSQVGARVNWHPSRLPVFATVRASAALATRDSEIAPGIGVRGRSVGVILEQRFSLERGQSSRTALVAYGGVDGVAAPLGFKLDGYAQAGAVGVSDPALFVDGAARAEREVARVGRARLGVGAAAWGAAQPGVSRVDVGPQVVAHLLIGPGGARLSAEYRFRIGGNTRPADGVAVTLGADF